MSKSYYKVKKNRQLMNNEEEIESNSNETIEDSNCNNFAMTAIDVNTDRNKTSIVHDFSYFSISNRSESNNFFEQSENIDDVNSENNDDDEVSTSHYEPNLDLTEKLRAWTLRNIKVLTLNVVTELINILKEEGHSSLPNTAQQLLKTQHCRKLVGMLSKHKTKGQYVYLGIKSSLEKIISPSVFTENEIAVQVHIDGASIFNNSLIQVWPIVLKVFHKNYISKPVVIAIYGGDSKPDSVDEYLNDFIAEATELIKTGVNLHNTKYNFKIFCIIADSPARAYIKCCKPPGSFYACERCITKGVTVNHTRVYPEIDSESRTKLSFETRKQSDHHQGNSPLCQLPNFDPVQSVVLDSMHLLYLGAMKSLLEKLLVTKKHMARLKKSKRDALNSVMNSISSDIPCEFERKIYDTNYVTRWKATQFRFFLLYCGPIVLKNILSKEKYEHFLLLSIAARILNSDEFCITYGSYAKTLLRNFFLLLPSLYGESSQVLTMHNLIHIADDTDKFKVPLSEISAFWGENYLSIFKRLVKSPKKPLTQIVNRLKELESGDNFKIMKKCLINGYKYKNKNIVQYKDKGFVNISEIELNGVILKPNNPNNIIQLQSGKVFVIKEILKVINNDKEDCNISDIYLRGYKSNKIDNVFNSPSSSIDVGIININGFSKSLKIIKAAHLKCKCVMLNINDKQYVITLLHALS